MSNKPIKIILLLFLQFAVLTTIANNFIALKLDTQEIVEIKGGLVSNSFYIQTNTDVDKPYYLKFIYPRLDSVWIYRSVNNIETLFYKNLGLKQSDKDYINYLVPLEKSAGETFRVVIKSSFPIRLPIIIEKAKTAVNKEHYYEMWFSLYAGIMLVMIFYNLFVFISTKDKIYSLYIIYIFAVLLTQLSIFGVTAKYFWYNSEWFNYQSVNILTCFVGIASLEFIRQFNKVKKFYPRINSKLFILNLSYLVCVFISISSTYRIPFAYNIISINASILGIIAVAIGYLIIKKGYRPARFFLIAWSIFIVGVVLFIMKDFGYLPVNFITKYTMPIGSALETVILSLALADRINTLKKEKEDSQAQTLQEMRKNQQLINEQNIILEHKVNERTAELELTLSNLKSAQAQLIDAEKMASLGQLTAGIAHEINNPINFVSSNIEPLKADIKDVIEILQQYKDKVKSLNTDDFKSITDYEKEIDLDYTIEEIDQLMKGIKEGATRTTEIVNSLRSFSRTDESTISTIDLHESLDATITILKNNLGKIKIVKEYGNLVPIEAYAGKLSQAFMNVINNALQAVEEKWQHQDGGQLVIKTELLDTSVSIKISDNGPGIPQEIVSKIFDPFFTTKEVGSGTGLGLSITYGIIEHHKGKIFVESDETMGTSMVIELPIKQK